MTFDPHPTVLLAPHRVPPNLTTLARKSELIAQCGVDVLIVAETTGQLLQQSPREFFDTIVRTQLQARGLVEGPNFFFGRDRAGDVRVLREFCDAAGLSLQVVAPVEEGGAIVSSSAVRKALVAGRVAAAVEMLGHPHQLTGCVVTGAERGRQIGFPTANLAEVATLLPADGVYAGCAAWEGRSIPAAVHIGPNPTFGEESRKVEVHLIGQSADLYGRMLSVDLLAEVRPTQTFATRDALVRQIEADVQQVREIVAGLATGGE
jgi:riboflavin kinase/FMN adenylyltransferase